ncbi:MAG: hypothetical protein A3E87_01475 [Gammaproteobacteria bacterium RIFCSPHIGHO2_12_FULL_35_23]|nr:MAG: hypothetical protein A3E87_01475 [Gammaproteobacteria bacterium RIFCSPHIGHO2_12_FULL_35_23]
MNEKHPHLSQREKQVIELTSQGFSSKEIARKLDIDFTTVEQYLFRVRKKLNAKNKTHAVFIVLSQQLISFEKAMAVSVN